MQIHGKEGDEFFEEDLPAARELVEIVGPDLAELFVYPGDAHLFTDRSLPAYDAEAAGLRPRSAAWPSSTASEGHSPV